MPQQPSQPRDWKLIVEKDVKIPMRDGAILYADVLRPDGGAERVPGHHEHRSLPEGPALDSARRTWRRKPIRISPGRRPTRCGGARADMRCVRVDSRGSGKSPGQVRSQLVPGGGGLLRCDRVDREARRGAPAISARSASPTTPTASGASPTCSRRPSRRSSPGKAAPTSTAIRPSTAASLPWASSIPGSPPTWRTT